MCTGRVGWHYEVQGYTSQWHKATVITTPNARLPSHHSAQVSKERSQELEYIASGLLGKASMESEMTGFEFPAQVVPAQEPDLYPLVTPRPTPRTITCVC